MSKHFKNPFLFFLITVLMVSRITVVYCGFRIPPYLQNPAPDAMTIMWFSEEDSPGYLVYRDISGSDIGFTSTPVLAGALAYSTWENAIFFTGRAPAPPYLHRIRLTGLQPNTTYTYTIEQGGADFSASFTTAPRKDRSIRFIVYADSETEPESTGKHADWNDPGGVNPDRIYLLDQTNGYANNLDVIRTRQPDFIIVAGDLVESGGEQRDWDEFWRHITDLDGTLNLAGQVPCLASLGNHEYYEGPQLGKYDQPGSERAVARYRTYFEFPANNTPDSEQEERYYRLDYGPVTLIVLDVANDSPHKSEKDTNFYLLGEKDTDGGHAPAFGLGSRQYDWLETQLREAQTQNSFTFVVFHHVPYSVGPHGWPAGEGEGFDLQSGTPVRALTQLFMRYGVDAVFAGHDEIWERSEISGEEINPDNTVSEHTIHFYDVGIGGDGLRGPQEGLNNPYQKFLVHSDAPEIWEKGILIDGGKHYGHLEVDVILQEDNRWKAVLNPVYVFPLFDKEGKYLGSERRVYNDIITLFSNFTTEVSDTNSTLPDTFKLDTPYPNPFNSTVLLRYSIQESSNVEMTIYDLLGKKVCNLIDKSQKAGNYSVEWSGYDETGSPVASGVYFVRLQAGSSSDTVKVILMK